MTPTSMEVDPSISVTPASPTNRRHAGGPHSPPPPLVRSASASRRLPSETPVQSSQQHRPSFLRSLSTPLSFLYPLQTAVSRELGSPTNTPLPRPRDGWPTRDEAVHHPDDEHASLMGNINSDENDELALRMMREGSAPLPPPIDTTGEPIPVPAAAPTPPVEDSEEQLRTEMRQLFRRVQHILPFVALFLVYFSYLHTKGIFVFVIGSTAIIALDQRFRAQVAMKDKASVLALLAIIFICFVDAFAICSINGDLTPWTTFLKRVDDPTSLGDVLWAVMVNDFLLRLGGVFVKALIAIAKLELCCCFRRFNAASLYRRKRKIYAAVEFTTLFLRSAVAALPWCAFYQASASKMVGDVFTVVYLSFKGFVLAGQARRVLTILRAALTLHLEYGTYVGPTDLVEAGSPECSICYDTMQVPVQLPCAHMFCEECVCEWFDRERSCPLCRADVISPANKPLYMDGGTSLFPQFL
ncbi:Aste57867_18787 [Aphanomyces stellatus]|uniref:Aste57867_18787 protein n=1 Tax=Aphanomyces stellatus TaxID=120398 RepID=A0A485LBL2_9STRA|nr:hypothetical protein As57867_018723 [Aphanomyces stellatus]VFT95521.1 Aste57867_18787 [Aphanomyces stellatus]